MASSQKFLAGAEGTLSKTRYLLASVLFPPRAGADAGTAGFSVSWGSSIHLGRWVWAVTSSASPASSKGRAEREKHMSVQWPQGLSWALSCAQDLREKGPTG